MKKHSYFWRDKIKNVTLQAKGAKSVKPYAKRRRIDN